MPWLPPVATALPLRTRLAPLRSGPEDARNLEALLKRRYFGDGATAFSSGRAALTTILQTLTQDREGRAVLVPAYTCYTVASAVARAGMTMVPVDVDPQSLDFDYRNRSNPPPPNAIAQISTGLFGIPPDLPLMQDICREHRLFMIEDAAQTLGATVDGHPAGSFGDAALFSFGRGKPLGGLGGGVLVARGFSLAERIERARPPEGRESRFKTAVMSVLSALAIDPRIFAWIRLLPLVPIGRSVFDPQFSIGSLTRGKARLLIEAMGELDALVRRRQERNAALRARLAGLDGIILPKPREGITNAALRSVVIFQDSADRDAVLYQMAKKGLGASTMYPRPIHLVKEARDYVRDDLGPFPGAEKIARGIVTLPTHDFVKEKHLDDMASAIRAVVTAGGA